MLESNPGIDHHQGVAEILLLTGDKRRPDGLLGSYADFYTGFLGFVRSVRQNTGE